jgi:hypothetical protein
MQYGTVCKEMVCVFVQIIFDIFCSSPDVNPPVHYFGPTEILYTSFHIPYMPVI